MQYTSSRLWRVIGATALAIGIVLPVAGPLRSAHTEAAGQTLQIYNDKATWTTWYNATGKQAMASTGIGWKSAPYADTTTYQAAIRTSGRTNKAPDLFSWWSGWLMKDIVDAGIAADISPLWNKYARYYSPGLRAAMSFNGKTYGMPENLAYWVVFYNKHVFAKYGLTPPTTWAQLMTINKTLRSHGVAPLAMTDSGRWPTFIYFEELVARTSPALYNGLVAGKIKYTDPRIVKVMDLWKSMIKEGDFTNPATTQFGTSGSNDMISYFIKGKVAMVELGAWYEGTMVAAGLKPGVDYGAFIMPDVNPSAGNVVIFEVGPLSVGAHSPNAAAAMKAADYFMSKAGQQSWIKTTGFISPRSDVESPNPVDHALGAQLNAGKYTLLQRYWEATPHDIVEVAIDQLDKFMLGKADSLTTLKAIQTQADQSWANLGKK